MLAWQAGFGWPERHEYRFKQARRDADTVIADAQVHIVGIVADSEPDIGASATELDGIAEQLAQ